MSSVFAASIQVFWAFASSGFFCELGGMVTDQFGKFNTKLAQCHWYSYPIKIQRMLLIFMVDTQQPVFIEGYGHIICIRENFKKVQHILFDWCSNTSCTIRNWPVKTFQFSSSQTINGGFSYLLTLQRINRYASARS